MKPPDLNPSPDNDLSHGGSDNENEERTQEAGREREGGVLVDLTYELGCFCLCDVAMVGFAIKDKDSRRLWSDTPPCHSNISFHIIA